jgi:hypothetical protein
LRVFDPCQMPLARRWPVIRICVRKLKECGTAFRRRLAIQFSKTEHHPGSEASMPLSQALTVAASRRPVLRRGGTDLLPLPDSVKGSRHEFSRPSLAEGGRVSIPAPSPRQGELRSVQPLPPSPSFVGACL